MTEIKNAPRDNTSPNIRQYIYLYMAQKVCSVNNTKYCCIIFFFECEKNNYSSHFTQFVSRFSNQVAGRTANGEGLHRTYTYVYYVTSCKFHV